MSNASAVVSVDGGDLKPQVAPIRRLEIPPGRCDVPGVFPFQPVFDLFWPNRPPLDRDGKRPDYTVATIALRLGVDRQYIYRWFHRGLEDRQADTIAIMLGLHPCALWPDWFAHAPSEDEVRQAERVIAMAKTPAQRRLLELRDAGLSHPEIARAMMDEGHRTGRGGRIWNFGMVGNSILRMRKQAAA